jgi:hypothetical protein
VQPTTIIATRRPNRSSISAAVAAVSSILDRVVQEAGDGHVLVATGLQHERRHAEQMAHVGNIAPLAGLVAVRCHGKGQPVDKT